MLPVPLAFVVVSHAVIELVNPTPVAPTVSVIVVTFPADIVTSVKLPLSSLKSEPFIVNTIDETVLVGRIIGLKPSGV